MGKPHFNLTFQLDITNWLHYIKEANSPFTPEMVYLLTHCANQVPQLRQRIRGDQVVEHESVHPSFTVMPDDHDTFSFCEVTYTPSRSVFVQSAILRIEEVRKNPSFEDEAGRDDYLYMSSIPWIPFTSMEHAMYIGESDSVPRITWGKYTRVDGRTQVPISVQSHHALVDGMHIGTMYEHLEYFVQHPGEL